MIIKSECIADLLDTKIVDRETDPLVITPQPNLDELRKSGSASIDLRLGTWFLTLRQAKMTHHGLEHERELQLTKQVYVPFGDSFVLHPRCFVLGVTLEWVRIPKNIAGYVIGKSSLGRRGLIIATATGFHPGFTGTLTLELSNVGEVPIKISPGMRICQLFLHEVKHKAGKVDCSAFIGYRKPVLGKITTDPVAEKLAGSSNEV